MDNNTKNVLEGLIIAVFCIAVVVSVSMCSASWYSDMEKTEQIKLELEGDKEK